MSTVGETIFDRTSTNHEEIWDDTELIRAYDRSHRKIQNRLRSSPKKKKEKTISPPPTKEKPIELATSSNSMPIPIPIGMISPPKDEQDALHSMLMAWYMAGYHAGQLAARSQQQKH